MVRYTYHTPRHLKLGRIKDQLYTTTNIPQLVPNHQHQYKQQHPVGPQHKSNPIGQDQKKTQTTTMPSADWEQHFLDKFLASSSRSSSPNPTASMPRNSSPARWTSSPRQSLDAQIPRNTSNSQRLPEISSTAPAAAAR